MAPRERERQTKGWPGYRFAGPARFGPIEIGWLWNGAKLDKRKPKSGTNHHRTRRSSAKGPTGRNLAPLPARGQAEIVRRKRPRAAAARVSPPLRLQVPARGRARDFGKPAEEQYCNVRLTLAMFCALARSLFASVVCMMSSPVRPALATMDDQQRWLELFPPAGRTSVSGDHCPASGDDGSLFRGPFVCAPAHRDWPPAINHLRAVGGGPTGSELAAWPLVEVAHLRELPGGRAIRTAAGY